MKMLKDLPKEATLNGVKVKTPKGVVGFIKSIWQKGVWLSDGKTNNIYPQFVDKTEDILSWELNPKQKANCNVLIQMKYIDNSIDYEKLD